MQEVTETYRAIVSGPYQTEVKVVIGDTEYGMDKLVSLNTSRAALGTGTPKLGSAVSREIDLTVYAESENIPRMAAIKPYVRVYNGVSDSEWISKGVFYIDTRQQNQDTLTIHGYDAMMLAEAQYPESDLDWPATDIEVVQEIADALDVDIDERTLALITQQFPIQMPDQYVTDDGETPDMGDVFTMRDVLAGIAGLYGGVFIFNDVGELQLLCPWDAPEETNYLTTENGDYITFGGTRILLWRDMNGVVKHVTGDIVHVDDALNKPIVVLSAAIEPTQSFNGYDRPWAGGANINLLPPAASLSPVTSGTATVTPYADGHYHVERGASGSTTTVLIPLASTVEVTTDNYYTPISSFVNGSITVNLANSSNSNLTGNYVGQQSKKCTAAGTAVKLRIWIKSTIENVSFDVWPILTTTQTNTWSPYANVCPISGETSASAYVESSYSGSATPKATVSWQSEVGTVYKGSIDFISGELTVTHANIASYAGETIGVPWLSSMDVYSFGATPTTGAQVVYPLATPLTYQLTATEIETLLGENYIWADTGDVSVDYVSYG